MHHVNRRNFLLLGAAAAVLAAHAPAMAREASYRQDKIFISSNSPQGNEVLVFDRNEQAPATLVARFATGGTGTGAGLGSQGAVTLSRDRQHLFVVNAGSHTVSTFAIRSSGLQLISVVNSGGTQPTSVTENDDIVYVLNAGGSGNVVGFRNRDGRLKQIPQSARGLSGTATAPAQVGFDAEGETVVVTERATQTVTSFAVRRDATLGTPTFTHSPGVTPFGFEFTRRNVLVVSEAAGGAAGASSASSYVFDDRGRASEPEVVSAAVPTTQTAACWVAVTPNGRYAFTANAGSSSVSSFRVERDGSLSLLEAQAGVTDNGGALDSAVSADGRQLHVFASRGLRIVSYRIGRDGALTALGSVGGIPNGSAGMAAN